MKKLLKNWEIKVLAVLAAIIFWFLVVATENTFYTFPEEVPVEAFNLPENLVVVEDLGTVKLRLKIESRETIKNLTVDDFNAYIDLKDTTIGEREADIEVGSKKPDINVVKVEPSEISVKIEEKAEKEIPVDYKIKNNPKEGFVVDEVEIEDVRTIVKGPEDILKEVDKAFLMLDLSDLEDDITSEFNVAVLNEEDEKIEEITFEKDKIEASVIINPVKDQKTAGVKPTIIGSPNNNVWIKSITVDPNYVVLNGSKDELDKIDFVQTTDIDVSGLSDDSTFDVSVIGLPEGVSIDEDTGLSVKIDVEKTNSGNISGTRKTYTLPVLVRKFKTDQKGISIDPMTVTLVLEGDAEIFNDISSKLNVELDISKYEGEEADIEITEDNIELPAGIGIVDITPSKVKVSWE